jgi:hypothetical protein
MNLLLGFLPFAVFATAEHVVPTLIALIFAAATAAALVARGVIAGRGLMWLDAGAALIFAALTLYTAIVGATWSIVGVRLCTDAGLFAIVTVSLLAGRPFTLAYAKEYAAPEIWTDPAFLSANIHLTAIWCAVFASMMFADVGMLNGLPTSAGVVITVAALAAGLYFTKKAAR